ncbi:hypothetical protein Dsin_003289 [Dipteronia sinensis]|uniref:EF-hand domain-containing protein n=1 Tax=Dipteronia sinensis TaxID=43782 RepID=A0AAE0B8P1_9ROSI|nr:hypothetical protein Dsin_003289 [Dipteronia sinensis]
MVLCVKATTAPPAPQTEKMIRELLKRHDSNNNNRLDKAEVQSAFDELGSKFSFYRRLRGIKIADENGDGVINMYDNELDNLVKYIMSKNYDTSKQKKLNAS